VSLCELCSAFFAVLDLPLTLKKSCPSRVTCLVTLPPYHPLSNRPLRHPPSCCLLFPLALPRCALASHACSPLTSLTRLSYPSLPVSHFGPRAQRHPLHGIVFFVSVFPLPPNAYLFFAIFHLSRLRHLTHLEVPWLLPFAFFARAPIFLYRSVIASNFHRLICTLTILSFSLFRDLCHPHVSSNVRFCSSRERFADVGNLVVHSLDLFVRLSPQRPLVAISATPFSVFFLPPLVVPQFARRFVSQYTSVSSNPPARSICKFFVFFVFLLRLPDLLHSALCSFSLGLSVFLVFTQRASFGPPHASVHITFACKLLVLVVSQWTSSPLSCPQVAILFHV